MSQVADCVFVVDDEPAIRSALRLLLRGDGYAVKTYESAVDALQAYDAEPPACVLTDYHMPGMDGLQLIREIHRRDANMPVIILTGRDDSGRIRLDEKVRLLEKPFDAQVLTELVRILIEQNRQLR